MNAVCEKIKTIDSIEAMTNEIKRLAIENENLKLKNEIIIKQLLEQCESTGNLSRKNVLLMKSIFGSYLLMKRFISKFKKRSDSADIHQICMEMQILCNDIDFRYSPSNLIDQEINSECFDCASYGAKEGECKGMVGGAPCLSHEEKIISIAPDAPGRFNFLLHNLKTLLK